MVPEHLADPLRWKKPRRIFVNSMSDLFHEALTNEQIAAVFGVMAAAPQHTFQILTKRAKRMLEWFEWFDERVREEAEPDDETLEEARADERSWLLAFSAADELANGSESDRDDRTHDLIDQYRDAWARNVDGQGTVWTMPWPLTNVWLGVSVENQGAADERIPELLATPAAVRFLSCEPLIGEVDLNMPRCDGYHCGPHEWCIADDGATPWCSEHDQERSYNHWLHLDGGIDWVIGGCESGPGARRCDVEWLRSLRDQCADAGVPFFLKQAVEQYRPIATETRDPTPLEPGLGSKRKAGGVIELPYLDGVQHAAFPELP